ncbi:MAG: helix-turn-helix transcriptional regulator [Flavobacteriales bacterium]|nr:helix-turn-helix transcriptional regulator [Flavobacteriales bacterium]
MKPPPTSPADDAPRVDLLTAMERHFIRWCCNEAGLPYKAIAVEMGIALSTLHTHRRKVFSKLKVPCRAALVVLAMKLGLG